MSDIIGIVNIVVSLAVTIGLFYVAGKARKIDKLEEKLDHKADQLITARFNAVAGELRSPMLRFEEIVKRIEQRLDHGDASFGEQAEVAHQLDKKILEATSDLRTWALENFASAPELHELRRSVQDMRVALAGKGSHR